MTKYLQNKRVTKIKEEFKRLTSPDYFMLTLVSIMTISGAIWILDASAVIVDKLGYFYYFQRQISFILVGIILGFITYKFYNIIHKYFIYILIFTILLLILVLIPGISKEVNGAYRWIRIFGVDIQPTEFAKLSIIIYLSSVISKFFEKLSLAKFRDLTERLKFYFLELWIPFFVVLSIFCGLILLQKDLGSVIVIALTSILIFFTSNSSIENKIFSIVLIFLLGIVTYFSIFAYEYRQGRFEIYKELFTYGNLEHLPMSERLGKGYQLEQILIAIGSGGVSGSGFTSSKQKYFYLVDQTSYTDTIFAVIAEETGLIGAFVYTLLFLLIVLRGMKIASQIYIPVYRNICYGIVFMIGVQSFFNICANLSIVPLKGLTLPFLSYGGSSIISLLIATGIYLKLSRYRELE